VEVLTHGTIVIAAVMMKIVLVFQLVIVIVTETKLIVWISAVVHMFMMNVIDVTFLV